MTEKSDEAKRITPFKIINRGEDTVDGDDNLVFADFSPRPISSDVEEEVIDPKEESAPVPAPSVELKSENKQTKSETNAPKPATSVSGQGKRNATS